MKHRICIIVLLLLAGATQFSYAEPKFRHVAIETRQRVWTSQNPGLLQRYEQQFIGESIETFERRTSKVVNFFAGTSPAPEDLIVRLLKYGGSGNSDIIFIAWPADNGTVFLQKATFKHGVLRTTLDVVDQENLPDAVQRQLQRHLARN